MLTLQAAVLIKRGKGCIYLSLPLHHRDPFDRILIAQAMNSSLSIASADIAFDAYETIHRVWGWMFRSLSFFQETLVTSSYQS
jgi:PIN domain nuclease of toxin-antitoxin system